MSRDASQLDDVKESFAEMDIHYDTDEEYEEALHNLTGFFDVLIQMDMEQKRKQSGAEKSPDNL